MCIFSRIVSSPFFCYRRKKRVRKKKKFPNCVCFSPRLKYKWEIALYYVVYGDRRQKKKKINVVINFALSDFSSLSFFFFFCLSLATKKWNALGFLLIIDGYCFYAKRKLAPPGKFRKTTVRVVIIRRFSRFFFFVKIKL